MGGNLSPKRVAFGVLAVIVLVAILAPVAYYATREDKRKDTGVKNDGGGSNIPPNSPEKLTQRIDCYPESGTVSADDCKKRNCLYHQSGKPGVPSCFFPVNEAYGFSAQASNENTPLGYRIGLQQRGTAPFETDNPKFQEPIFEVEFLGENLAHFKVYKLTYKHFFLCNHELINFGKKTLEFDS